MAVNIGTQAASLIDAAHETTWALDALGRLGTNLQSGYDPHDFTNLLELLAKVNNERVCQLTEYFSREVLPIVSHINKGVAK